ncbi:MAG: alpha/beta hydrolase [Oscillospiraceae bacterium]|nr:alpha/beta hydrolase [Oscillospiraceae bacterium]
MKMFKHKSIARKRVLRMIGIILGTVIGALLLFCFVVLLIVWSWSPSKIEPYYDDSGKALPGSISEIIHMEIGNVEQGMIIKGKDVNNPVLLFLHGGPGNPQYVIFSDIGLEDYFTVCWWDQHGSGMSYSSKRDCESVTLEQMVSDTVEVTNYLRQRFGKEKIYLMGQSFGSFLGINTVDRHPELYEAYIGINQVTNQLESEKLGYESMMYIAQASGDKESIQKLDKYQLDGADTITNDYLALRSSIMLKQGTGTFHNNSTTVFQYAIMPLLKAREYTLSDKYGFIAGSLFMLNSPVNKAQFTTNVMETIPKIDIPVYILHGVYDRQASYELSQRYIEILKAPKKEFYAFESSAHGAHMEEPERVIEIIREDILGIGKEGNISD